MSGGEPAQEAGLAVRTRGLGPAFDLLAGTDGFCFERGGLGVAADAHGDRIAVAGGPGRLEALAEEALRRLRAVRREGEASPVAVGAIAFGEAHPAELLLPERAILRRRPGRTVEIRLRPGTSARERPRPAPRLSRAVPHAPFRDVQLRPEPPPERYRAAVEACVEQIRAGALRKVVLARTIMVDAGRPLDPRQLAWRLRAVEPDCFTFVAPVRPGPPEALLVGASPELLVRRTGLLVESTPLAGSAPRSGDPEVDRASAEALRASAKEREEHAVVVEAVREALAPRCAEIASDGEPVLLGTANVWHLATRFRGRLREPAPSALQLVASLHPTPAVGGVPPAEALRAIAQLEPFDRGAYAGPVGWMDAEGDGEWAVALRCAELAGRTARLFAGAGIVAGSDADLELDETERKFRAFLDSLRWG